MKFPKALICTIALASSLHVNALAHEMQHGFVLGENDVFASHLVATGHHSRQVEIVGRLVIRSGSERAFYEQRKKMNVPSQAYFLFQAQHLDLPNLKSGKILVGHIVESKIGSYEPQNVIVKSAMFQVQRVLLNIPNPFFSNETVLPNKPSHLARPKRHCCETSAKPCNWKC